MAYIDYEVIKSLYDFFQDIHVKLAVEQSAEREGKYSVASV